MEEQTQSKHNPMLNIFGAAKQGDLDTLKWLVIVKKENVSQREPIGEKSALLLAAERGYTELVKWLLLEGGATLAEKDNQGCSALLLAVEGGFLKTVQWLLVLGADVFYMHYWVKSGRKIGRTPLMLAAEEGHTEIVKWLVVKGGANIARTNAQRNTALYYLIEKGHTELVKWVLTRGGANISTIYGGYGEAALLAATRVGNNELVKWMLLEGGAKITDNCSGKTALLIATEKDNTKLVKWLLIVGGADIRNRALPGGTALLIAAERGNKKLVKWLLTKGGAKITEMIARERRTALIIAAENGDIELVQWLLMKGGANLNEKNHTGQTVLMIAIQKGHAELAKWILEAGDALLDVKTKKLLSSNKKFLDILFSIISVPKDGNCLFTAIEKFTRGHTHTNLRQLVVSHMQKNKLHFQNFLPKNTAFLNYLLQMKKSGTWGGSLEIAALSAVLDRPIYVYKEVKNFPVICFNKASTSEPIYLYHDGINHYQALKPPSKKTTSQIRLALNETITKPSQSQLSQQKVNFSFLQKLQKDPEQIALQHAILASLFFKDLPDTKNLKTDRIENANDSASLPYNRLINERDKARNHYNKGKAAYRNKDLKEAMSEFGNAKDAYKDILSSKPASEGINTKRIQNRVAKLSKDGKYSGCSIKKSIDLSGSIQNKI